MSLYYVCDVCNEKIPALEDVISLKASALEGDPLSEELDTHICYGCWKHRNVYDNIKNIILRNNNGDKDITPETVSIDDIAELLTWFSENCKNSSKLWKKTFNNMDKKKRSFILSLEGKDRSLWDLLVVVKIENMNLSIQKTEVIKNDKYS